MPRPTARKRTITDVSHLIQSLARFNQLRRRDDLCRQSPSASVDALETIGAAGEIGVTGLATELALNESLASRVVESLRGVGLVTWAPAPGDARAKRVHDKGANSNGSAADDPTRLANRAGDL